MYFAYEITGDKSNKCEICDTLKEANILKKQGYLISNVEINWSEKMYADGIVIDRPIITPEPIPVYVPTIQDKTNEINSRYQIKLDTLKDNILSAVAIGGANKDIKIANFQKKYNDLLIQKNKELEEL